MSIIGAINSAAFNTAGSVASPALTYLMQHLAESFYVVLPLIAIYMYLRRDKSVFSFVVAIVVLFVVTEIIKDIVREPRPCEATFFSWLNGVACESGFSFPSNHAATLTGLLLFVRGYRYLRLMYLAWLVLLLFGRIYLAQHYFTDVVAGVVLSVVVAYLVYRERRKIDRVLGGIAHRILPMLFGGEWAK